MICYGSFAFGAYIYARLYCAFNNLWQGHMFGNVCVQDAEQLCVFQHHFYS